jgi:hypothetical protein
MKPPRTTIRRPMVVVAVVAIGFHATSTGVRSLGNPYHDYPYWTLAMRRHEAEEHGKKAQLLPGSERSSTRQCSTNGRGLVSFHVSPSIPIRPSPSEPPGLGLR